MSMKREQFVEDDLGQVVEYLRVSARYKAVVIIAVDDRGGRSALCADGETPADEAAAVKQVLEGLQRLRTYFETRLEGLMTPPS